jgi:hypothetical protein
MDSVRRINIIFIFIKPITGNARTTRHSRILRLKINQSHYEVIDYETGEVVDLKPEYTTMSRRPGIAGDWFDKYKDDVYPSDTIHLSGREMRPPKCKV